MPLVVPSAPTIVRTVAGNRNTPPIYLQTEAASNTRNQRVKRKAASNANWRDLELSYFGFQMAGVELPLGVGFSFRAAIEYPLGVYYPVTFNGLRDATFADASAQIIKSDPVSRLQVPGGADYFEIVRRTFPRLNGANNLITCETDLAFGEWSYSSNDGADYTLGGAPGAGAVGYINLSGTSIASVYIPIGGTGYTGNSVNLYAFDPNSGAHTAKLIGTRPVSNGVVTPAFIPAGSLQNTTGWGPSTILVIAPNGSALTKDVWCAGLVTGTPDRPVDSMIINGDSIARGYSAGDGLGDEARNYGVYERAIGSRIGVINFSYPGIAVGAYLPFATKFPLCHSAYDAYASIVLVQAGTNDIGAGASGGNAANLMGQLSAEWRAKGARVLYSTMPPRTNKIDDAIGWTTLANQTPYTDFQAGKGMEQLNASIKYRQGNMVGDFPPIDYHSVAADPSDPYRWRVDGGAHTNDGGHPGGNLGVRVGAEALAKILPKLT